MTGTVLAAGATGTLEARISHFLVAPPAVSVKLLARTGWDDDTAERERIEPLLQVGASVAIGAYPNPLPYRGHPRCRRRHLCASRRRHVMVDGQTALAAAAVRSGVRRFIPSDFAIDLFKGAFMDTMFNPGSYGPVDLTTGTVAYWGTGDERRLREAIEAKADPWDAVY
jgi:hypothetical protein